MFTIDHCLFSEATVHDLLYSCLILIFFFPFLLHVIVHCCYHLCFTVSDFFLIHCFKGHNNEDDVIPKSSCDSESSPQHQNCLPSANEECHNKDNSKSCIFLQLNIDNKMNLVYLLTLYTFGIDSMID